MQRTDLFVMLCTEQEYFQAYVNWNVNYAIISMGMYEKKVIFGSDMT